MNGLLFNILETVQGLNNKKGQIYQKMCVCVSEALPSWRIDAKMLLVDSVKWTKVFHAPHIQVDKDDVFHPPAFAVQLTWTQSKLYINFLS